MHVTTANTVRLDKGHHVGISLPSWLPVTGDFACVILSIRVRMDE